MVRTMKHRKEVVIKLTEKSWARMKRVCTLVPRSSGVEENMERFVMSLKHGKFAGLYVVEVLGLHGYRRSLRRAF